MHCIILHMLHLQLDPKHVLTYSLNIDVKDSTLERS